jgi:hypothetical protein
LNTLGEIALVRQLRSAARLALYRGFGRHVRPFSPFPEVISRREEGKAANRQKRKMHPARAFLTPSSVTHYDRKTPPEPGAGQIAADHQAG